MSVMPAAFFGHGNPMNALETQPVHRGLARVRPVGAPAAGDPRRLGALVRARDRRHRDATTAHACTTSSAFRRSSSTSDYERTRAAGAVRRDRRHRAAHLGGRRHRQLGLRPRHLVGPPARLSRRRHPGRAAVDQRAQVLRLPPAARRRSRAAARGRRPGHRQRQRRAQPRRRQPGPAGRRVRLGAAVRRAGQGGDADRPDGGRAARRAPRLRPRRARRRTTSCPCSTSPGSPARRAPRPRCSSTATPTARCR